jgi:hypothetical protein
MKKNDKLSIRKSIEKDGMIKSLEVNEVENGFVIKITKEGEGKDGWMYDCKTYISSTNPLNENSDSITLSDSMLDSINSML